MCLGDWDLLLMHHMEHIWTMVVLKICKHTFYAYLSRIWKMMQFTGLIRKVFVTKILLSGKFSPFLTLIIVLWSSCLWVTEGWKKPNLQKSTVGYHFGASWKAVMTQSLTFEQRQIEGRPWWQNWPILYALQLCCWVEDLKMNSVGSTPANMKM